LKIYNMYILNSKIQEEESENSRLLLSVGHSHRMIDGCVKNVYTINAEERK